MAEKSNIKHMVIDVLKIQVMVLFFSIINVLSKYVSQFEFLSVNFILIYSVILICFLVYAFFWQKLLKKNSLFKVYSNRAMLAVYALIWSVLLFSETITVNNIIGVVIIIIGILVVFSDDH
jgi:drug/metabolite transporter (DMT)-like permease